MKRTNIILTKEQTKFLSERSWKHGLTKTGSLKHLLSSKKKENFFDKVKFRFESTNLFGATSFNFRIDEITNSWLEETSNIYNCTKSDVVRFIINYEITNQTQPFVFSYGEKKENLIETNIASYISSYDYQGLNKYLVNINHNELINLGKPEMILDSITKLQNNYHHISSEITILKTEMLWFLGRTTEAVQEILMIITGKEKNFRALLLYSEIMNDLGDPNISSMVLNEITNLDTSAVSIKTDDVIKAYDKLGLSMYYTDSLDKVKQSYAKALSLAVNDEQKAVSHRYLGSVYYSLEEFDNSEKHYNISEDFYNSVQHKNLDEYCRMLVTYAHLQLNKANWYKAKQYCNRAIEIAKQINHASNLSWAYRIMAEALCGLGQYAEMMNYIDNAIKIGEQINSHAHLMKAYRNKSKYLLEAKDFNGASYNIHLSSICERKLVGESEFEYDMACKWQNYLNFINNKPVAFNNMHKQSKLLSLKKHFKDETLNNYVLAYLYYAAKDPDQVSKGKAMLTRLHEHAMTIGDKKVQFAIESIFKFNKFTAV